ncbi:hypothetical protein WN55_09696 [Dufourea novaeangliae]|uniref:Uncharacterized protein n=1 Tax=Dufourea novaeangliae TaxID=178035 RepID=A0A154NZ41_DUFNO|nr:hypothetical protein WN55_09696 [Dufourea novaeangliae]
MSLDLLLRANRMSNTKDPARPSVESIVPTIALVQMDFEGYMWPGLNLLRAGAPRARGAAGSGYCDAKNPPHANLRLRRYGSIRPAEDKARSWEFRNVAVNTSIFSKAFKAGIKSDTELRVHYSAKGDPSENQRVAWMPVRVPIGTQSAGIWTRPMEPVQRSGCRDSPRKKARHARKRIGYGKTVLSGADVEIAIAYIGLGRKGRNEEKEARKRALVCLARTYVAAATRFCERLAARAIRKRGRGERVSKRAGVWLEKPQPVKFDAEGSLDLALWGEFPSFQPKTIDIATFPEIVESVLRTVRPLGFPIAKGNGDYIWDV